MIARLRERVLPALGGGADVIDLVIRLYVAEVFFRSGMLKIANWPSTLYLFREEYRVPLLPAELAAVLGTFGELALPVLLALGLASRLAALGLSVVNLVAVISFWHVLRENEAALMSHWYWGLLLLVILLHGPGRLSVDRLIAARWPVRRELTK
jgi:putative oxidoreductase